MIDSQRFSSLELHTQASKSLLDGGRAAGTFQQRLTLGRNFHRSGSVQLRLVALGGQSNIKLGSNKQDKKLGQTQT